MEKSPGGSADTFRAGLFAYLDKHSVDMIVYENSDHLADDNQHSTSNYDIFRSEMASRSFEGQCFLLNSKLFGVPQSRRRFWAVFYATCQTALNYSDRSVVDMLATMRSLLQVCQIQCPSPVDVLLPEDSAHVSTQSTRSPPSLSSFGRSMRLRKRDWMWRAGVRIAFAQKNA